MVRSPFNLECLGFLDLQSRLLCCNVTSVEPQTLEQTAKAQLIFRKKIPLYPESIFLQFFGTDLVCAQFF